MNNELIKQLLIVLGIAALVMGAWMLHWYLTRSKGIMTGFATVLSKTPELGYGGKWSSGWNYRAVFSVGNTQLILYVLKSDYELLREGMTGLLTWQEENMLNFVPDKEDAG